MMDDTGKFNEILIQMYCGSIDNMWGLTSGTFVIHCRVLAMHSWILSGTQSHCTVGCHMVTHSD